MAEGLRDARHAIRMLRSRAGFTAAVVLSLAAGIGANAAIFSVIHAVLLKPLPYPDAAELVGVYNTLVIQGQRIRDASLSPGMHAAAREHSRVFERFGVWTSGAATVTQLGDPEQIVSVTMTEGVLPALAVRPHLGRWFSLADDSQGTPETAILSYGYWQRKFGGNPQVLGRTLVVDFVPRQVIGVMPQGFRFVNLSPDVFLPQRFPTSGLRADVFSYNGIARLKPGVTVDTANQDTARVWRLWSDSDPRVARMLGQLALAPDLRALKQDVVGDVGMALNVIMGALVLVLLLVCANVANLLLVRAQARSREFAIRRALGAPTGRIARELLTESLVLGALGGVFGLTLAHAGLRLLVARAPANLPRLEDVYLNPAVLVFAAACSLLVSVLCALPAVFSGAMRSPLETARGATPGAAQLRAQHAFVVIQVALALVLLVGSGLMIRTFIALGRVVPGFTGPEQIQTVRIAIPEALTPDVEQVIRMQAAIAERMAGIPGVTAVGFASALPLESEYRNGIVVAVEGKTRPDEMPPNRALVNISPGLLTAQGTRLVAGRDFTWDDVFGQMYVALVSENMARETWGSPLAAIGKRIRLGRDGPWNEVVGVVEDVHAAGVDKPAPATVYARVGVVPPVRPGGNAAVRRAVTFAIRSPRAGGHVFVRELTAAVHGASASLPLAKVRTLDDVYQLSTARTSFTLVLLGIAAALALAIAVVGVYGVLAYAVAQRRHELGIRSALGSRPDALAILFVRQGLALACVGTAIGLVSAAIVSRSVASLLFGVPATDPVTYIVAAAVIGSAALAASYIPARRAARVDPMETLRAS